MKEMTNYHGNYLRFFRTCLLFGLFVNKTFLESTYKLNQKRSVGVITNLNSTLAWTPSL